MKFKNLPVLLVAIMALGFVFTGCEKENFDETSDSDNVYLYSKSIIVENDGATVEAVISTNNEELLNTTLNVESITQFPEYFEQNEDGMSNEEDLNKLENNIADVKIEFVKIQKNENLLGVKITPIRPDDNQKLLYLHTYELNWGGTNPQINIDGCEVYNTTGKNCYAVFKWKKYGGLWNNIFRQWLNTKGDYVFGQVPSSADKLNLKIGYNASAQPFQVNFY